MEKLGWLVLCFRIGVKCFALNVKDVLPRSSSLWTKYSPTSLIRLLLFLKLIEKTWKILAGLVLCYLPIHNRFRFLLLRCTHRETICFCLKSHCCIANVRRFSDTASDFFGPWGILCTDGWQLLFEWILMRWLQICLTRNWTVGTLHSELQKQPNLSLERLVILTDGYSQAWREICQAFFGWQRLFEWISTRDSYKYV